MAIATNDDETDSAQPRACLGALERGGIICSMSSVDRPDALAHEGPLIRGIVLLRLLAAAGRRGVALTQLAKSAGLPNSSVHRLLTQLREQRLVMQIDGSARYVIGPLAYELGLVAAHQFDIRELCQPAMERLALEAADTVYLVQRSGTEAVCVDLRQGPTAMRVTALQIGSRRPLGLGAGGLAILAAMPEDEAREVLASVAGTIENEWHFPEATLKESLQAARARGLAVIENRINPGVTAIGRSFRDSLGHVFGAITVAGSSARLTKVRTAAIEGSLREAAQTIERALRGHQWARYASGVKGRTKAG